MSIARSAISSLKATRSAARRTSANIPSSSTSVSPFARSEIINAVICDGVASPESTDLIAAPA